MRRWRGKMKEKKTLFGRREVWFNFFDKNKLRCSGVVALLFRISSFGLCIGIFGGCFCSFSFSSSNCVVDVVKGKGCTSKWDIFSQLMKIVYNTFLFTFYSFYFVWNEGTEELLERTSTNLTLSNCLNWREMKMMHWMN